MAEVMNIIGDVEGKVAVMVDDMIDTAGTITKGGEVLLNEGARCHRLRHPPRLQRASDREAFVRGLRRGHRDQLDPAGAQARRVPAAHRALRPAGRVHLEGP